MAGGLNGRNVLNALEPLPEMTAVLYREPPFQYPEAVSAEGSWITDARGQRYLDMSGGAAVSCVGHGHPTVVQAIRQQLDTMAFAHTAFFTNTPQEALAERLRGRIGDDNARVYFSSGGSEANETALKLAWQYQRAVGEASRQVVISREHSYHGNTFGTLSVSGNPGRRRASAAPLLDWPRIPPCYPLREQAGDESLAQYAQRSAEALEQAILEAGPGNVAAFICEPVVGSSLGVVAPPQGYLARVRDICDRYGVLWIADEIMCGSGRTGTWFAFEQLGPQPDIVTLAKGIGGGYVPLAATVLNGRIAEVLEAGGFAHGHTYVGHATACAAGLAVQTVFDEENLLERAAMNGRHLAALLNDRFGQHPNVAEVRGMGMFHGLELVADRETLAGFHDRPGIATDIRRAAMTEGLVCYPGSITVSGATVPHIMLAPPLTATVDELAEGVDRLARALARVLQSGNHS